MLGLGDVVMPGLLLCFVMRYDAYKRAQVDVIINDHNGVDNDGADQLQTESN